MKRAPRNKEASVCTSECKQRVNYCYLEDRKVMVCVEGFIERVLRELEKSSGDKYIWEISLWRKE